MIKTSFGYGLFYLTYLLRSKWAKSETNIHITQWLFLMLAYNLQWVASEEIGVNEMAMLLTLPLKYIDLLGNFFELYESISESLTSKRKSLP